MGTQDDAHSEGQELEEVVLETEVAASFPAPSVVDIRREATASFLAKAIAVVFVITAISPLIYLFIFKSLSDNFIDFIKTVMTPEATLLGLIIGFYFSEKRLGN